MVTAWPDALIYSSDLDTEQAGTGQLKSIVLHMIIGECKLLSFAVTTGTYLSEPTTAPCCQFIGLKEGNYMSGTWQIAHTVADKL